MKKQLLGIFLGLSMLESISVLHAKEPVVHFDADDYLDYEGLEETEDLDGTFSFRPKSRRIKRSKALPADESALKKPLKDQHSKVVRAFFGKLKHDPRFRHNFKEALHKIKIGLSDSVSDVGFDAQSRSPEQKQQLIDAFNQGDKGDVLGTRSEPRDNRIQNNRDVVGESGLLNAEDAKDNANVRDIKNAELLPKAQIDAKKLSNAQKVVGSLEDKAKNAGNYVLSAATNGINDLKNDMNVVYNGVKGALQGGKDVIGGFLQKGKDSVEEVARRAKNAVGALKGQNFNNTTNLLDDDSVDQSINNSSKLQNTGEMVQEENWQDVLEGTLHKKTAGKNKVLTAIKALKKLGQFDRDEVKEFVSRLKNDEHITEPIYNHFIQEFENAESATDDSKPSDNTRAKKVFGMEVPQQENKSGPAYNTRAKKNK